MEEFELSNLCRAGDNRARKELYERFSGRMFGICLRYTGDRDTAQDMLHDGFLKMYASFDKFTWRGEGSLRAWMERVLINSILQSFRKNDVMNRTIDIEEVSDLGEEPDPSDVETISQTVLMKFINELPDGYRTVFNLYTFEEKSHKEIAQLLGINEKSSASQLFRAKSVLAKKIKEYMARQIC
ncbi:sigma-70 family RNA polymerase sigma factor [Bacteroides sp. OttesenSCG-928-D19]|nr:sigma-70 family RNA polymerase sigma factor [Bacteroides sp. OttesenSCG-928-D19]